MRNDYVTYIVAMRLDRRDCWFIATMSDSINSRAQLRVRDTEEQRRRRREADRERKRQKRAATRDAYRAANRLRMAANRTVEPPEETVARREIDRGRAAERMLSESLEETAARR